MAVTAMLTAGARERRPLGFRAAAAATGLAVLFGVAVLVAGALSPVSPWEGIGLYAAEFEGLQMLPFVPALLLAPVLVLVMACVHRAAPEEQRSLGLAAFGFTLVYATIVSLNYTTQLTTVRHGLLANEIDGLALYARPNLQSLFTAHGTIGYLFLGLATLAAAPIVARAGRVGVAVAALFAFNALLAGLGFVAAVAGWEPLLTLGLAAWFVSFPLATALLALLFSRPGPLAQAAG
jgi:hypothetical protein